MDWYRQALAQIPGVSLQPGYFQGGATATTSILLPPGTTAQVADSLLRSGIETRAWWGQGCHVQPAFRDCPRADLPMTEDLGSRVLGLPHFPDMERDTVRQVASSLSQALRNLAPRRRAS
jgi:dTDP-4-amino-4,6-dideoxygalactose transaminase